MRNPSTILTLTHCRTTLVGALTQRSRRSLTLTAVWSGKCSPEALTTPPHSLPGSLLCTLPSSAILNAVPLAAMLLLLLGGLPSSPLAARHPSDPVCRPATKSHMHNQSETEMRMIEPVTKSDHILKQDKGHIQSSAYLCFWPHHVFCQVRLCTKHCSVWHCICETCKTDVGGGNRGGGGDKLRHMSASAPGKVCSCRVVGAFAWLASSACSSRSTCSHSAFSSAVHPLQQWATKSHK